MGCLLCLLGFFWSGWLAGWLVLVSVLVLVLVSEDLRLVSEDCAGHRLLGASSSSAVFRDTIPGRPTFWCFFGWTPGSKKVSATITLPETFTNYYYWVLLPSAGFQLRKRFQRRLRCRTPFHQQLLLGASSTGPSSKTGNEQRQRLRQQYATKKQHRRPIFWVLLRRLQPKKDVRDQRQRSHRRKIYRERLPSPPSKKTFTRRIR